MVISELFAATDGVGFLLLQTSAPVPVTSSCGPVIVVLGIVGTVPQWAARVRRACASRDGGPQMMTHHDRARPARHARRLEAHDVGHTYGTGTPGRTQRARRHLRSASTRGSSSRSSAPPAVASPRCCGSFRPHEPTAGPVEFAGVPARRARGPGHGVPGLLPLAVPLDAGGPRTSPSRSSTPVAKGERAERVAPGGEVGLRQGEVPVADVRRDAAARRDRPRPGQPSQAAADG